MFIFEAGPFKATINAFIFQVMQFTKMNVTQMLLCLCFCCCVYMTCVKFPQCNHVYAAHKQQRIDNEWLRDKCNEPIFFTRMSRQRPEVCSDAMSTYEAHPIIVALQECFALDMPCFVCFGIFSGAGIFSAVLLALLLVWGVPIMQSRYSQMRALQLYKKLVPRYGFESKYVV